MAKILDFKEADMQGMKKLWKLEISWLEGSRKDIKS